MRIAICDDDQLVQEQLLQILHEKSLDADVECYSDGASLLQAARQTPPIDLVYLDIYMPGEDGMETAKALLKIAPRVGLVFVTSSREHAVDAFSLYALHYLVKPITAEGVTESLRRLRETHPELQESLTFTYGRVPRRILLSDICSIVTSNHAVEITQSSGEQFRIWMTFSELEQKLSPSFLKVNRGVLINMDYIEEMRSDRCILQNGKVYYLAIRERGSICAAYQDYQLDRLARKKREMGL